MVSDEVFGDCAIEPLDGTIHGGTPRVAVVVPDPPFLTCFMEEMCELRTIVGLYLSDLKGSDLDEFLQEVSRCLT